MDYKATFKPAILTAIQKRRKHRQQTVVSNQLHKTKSLTAEEVWIEITDGLEHNPGFT